MLDNWEVRIRGKKVILVPYRKKYVDIYHKWMTSQELLESTASEPLSIEEEYEMQLSWKNDPFKCTFILIDVRDMKPCGDVNLFFNEPDWLDEYNAAKSGSGSDNGGIVAIDPAALAAAAKAKAKKKQDDPITLKKKRCSAEIEVMVAEAKSRGNGVAKEALMLLMWWAHKVLGTSRFVAKIGDKNTPSIHLFNKSLGFQLISHSEYFEETTFELMLMDVPEVFAKIDNTCTKIIEAKIEHDADEEKDEIAEIASKTENVSLKASKAEAKVATKSSN